MNTTYSFGSTGTVSFASGYKPTSIRLAQRDVRDIYLELCKRRAPRQPAVARAFYLNECIGNNYKEVIEASPLFNAAIDSAVRAYSYMGSDLEKRTMYSMNLFVPIKVLQAVPDLPESLATAAEGRTELCFEAKEIKGLAPLRGPCPSDM